MTDYPSGPRAVARAVLKAIEAQPDLFDMRNWATLGPGAELLPPLPGEDVDTCGTVMCAAGWAVHLTGWTLEGGAGLVIATKTINGEKVAHTVAGAAELELGLSAEETFWYQDEHVARRRLREIAELPAGG